MAISKLYIKNFKGIAASNEIKIKPITIFVGANSSGKSSCIHAMACLSQSVKVTNNTRPLILDDEFANIHLGRFIDVIHSKSYQDQISLGLCVENIPYFTVNKGNKPQRIRGMATANYNFKCTKRTQDIILMSADITVGDDVYSAKKTDTGYTVTHANGSKLVLDLEAAFLFSPASLLRKRKVNIEPFFSLLQAQESIKNELANTFYLGPFRQAPMRSYATRGSSPIEVGPMGESTITLLANEIVQSKTRPHIKQITKWLKTLGLASSLEVSRVARSDLFDVSMKLEDGVAFPIADLGYGISQVLPVLTQCSFAPKNSTLLFEQPEIHLHSISAKKLAQVFFETASDKGCNIVIETHSQDFLKQCFQELQQGRIALKDFVVYRVARSDGESKLKKIEIDEDFDVYENWEKGISIE